jgi:L-alanine-DL-glutamate epimerase-like enolase superfamily enzyme
MRVGRVEAFAVRYPEPNNDGKIRALTLVRVETDDGLVGWGEAITGGQETSLAVAFVVERRLAPLVLGGPRDAGRLEPPPTRPTGRQRQLVTPASAPSTWRLGRGRRPPVHALR